MGREAPLTFWSTLPFNEDSLQPSAVSSCVRGGRHPRGCDFLEIKAQSADAQRLDNGNGTFTRITTGVLVNERADSGAPVSAGLVSSTKKIPSDLPEHLV